LEAIQGENHPSARDIFDKIVKLERISLGTVYRNLFILEDEGEIVQVKSDPALVRYDCKLYPHHHLHCKVCGKIYDMPLVYDAGFDRKAAEESGCQIEGHSITFKGICRECMEKS
jgi:Fe2+ or Zn2+ uptake regulation protein